MRVSLTIHKTVPAPLKNTQAATAVAFMESHRGIPVRDLIHVAVMLNNGIRTIVSADKHFDLFPEIHRIDPFDIQQEAVR